MTDPDNEAQDHAESPHPENPVEGGSTEGKSSAYKSLWLPLVIVPGVIVATILLVFVLFGSIAGEEHTLEQNLQMVVSGGANEREQAVFSMVRQLEQNRLAKLQGKELPWAVGPEFVADLRATWDRLPEDDLDARLVVATTLSQMDENEGVGRLLTLLGATEEQDPEGSLRFHALAHLGASGDLAARPGLLSFLDSEDAGLRGIAVIGLQNMPGEESLVALSEALSDPEFEVRANAALALSHLGDERGASLLLDMLDAETYAAINRENREKFARSESISHSRAAAVLGLGDLKRAQDRAILEQLAEQEEDLQVREAAMRVVAAWDEKSE